MKVGIIGGCALGLTVALTIGAAPARAQNTGSANDTTARAGTTAAPGSTSGTTTATQGRSNMSDTTNMNMNMTGRMNVAGTDTTNMSGRRSRSARSRRYARSHRRHLASGGATSSERIPLTKTTSGGEVTQPDTTTYTPAPAPTPAPIDTTTRVDTTTTTVDTTAQVDTTTRVDTTTATVTPSISMRQLGSFYWGIGGGTAMPSEQTRNGFHPGWNITVPFGWDPSGSPLGLRFDAGYSRMMGRSDAGVGTDVGVWSGNADLKLRAPFHGMLSLLDHLYGVGGIGVSRIVGYAKSDNTSGTLTGQQNGYGGAYTNGTQISNTFSDAKTEFGWNAGGGISFGWGRSALFLESRYFSVNTSSSFGAKTHFVPIILGLTFR